MGVRYSKVNPLLPYTEMLVETNGLVKANASVTVSLPAAEDGYQDSVEGH